MELHDTSSDNYNIIRTANWFYEFQSSFSADDFALLQRHKFSFLYYFFFLESRILHFAHIIYTEFAHNFI